MKFVSVAELKTESKATWEKLKKDEIVLTNNGKPIALMTSIDEENFESTLEAMRKVKVMRNLEAHWNNPNNALKQFETEEEVLEFVNAEIKAYRDEKREKENEKACGN